MTERILAGTPASTTSQTGDANDDELMGLVLSNEDAMHAFSLLDLAQESLPNSTDDDAARAALRALKDFLMKADSAAPATIEAPAPAADCVGFGPVKEAASHIGGNATFIYKLADLIQLHAGDDDVDIIFALTEGIMEISKRVGQLAESIEVAP